MSSVLNGEPEVCNVLGDSITLRITKDQTDGQYSVAEFATPEGVGQPPHTHAWDETYLVLEGELNLNVDGQPTIVASGECQQVKSGVVHAPIPKEVFADTSWLDGLEALKGFSKPRANKSDLSDMARCPNCHQSRRHDCCLIHSDDWIRWPCWVVSDHCLISSSFSCCS